MALIGLAIAGAVLEGGLRLYAELRAPRFVGLATPTDDTNPDPLLVAWFKPNYVTPGGTPAFDDRACQRQPDHRHDERGPGHAVLRLSS